MKKGLLGTLTGLLGLGMTLGAVSPAFAAQPAKDINGHWAEKQLQEWVNQGTLKGFEDGTVRPNQSITRAEFIALVNRIFGYTESAQVQFSDLSNSNWAYTDVAKAVRAGYVQGYQDQTIHPSADVTRQEAAAMIAKVVGLTAGQTDSLSTFKDADRISAWSKQGVAAVLESKIMNGYPDQTFEPQKSLTRAEAVVLIDAAFAKKVSATLTFDHAGTYGGTDQEIQVIHGNVVISAPGVTLQNVEVQGNLTLAEGIGSGDATLKNVKVHGTTNVQGGGENSIHFVDSVLVNIVVNKKDGTVRIVAEGSTVTQSVVVKSSAKLEEDHASSEGFTNVELSKELPTNAKVTLNGTFDDVDVFAASISVQLVKGSIENVQVDGSAGNTSIELSSEAKIVKLVLDAVAKLLGSGQIQTATINDGAKGSTFQTKPNQTEGSQKDSIQVNTPASSGSSGGSSSEGSSGGSSSGSNGGGNNSGGTTEPADTVAPVITLKGEGTVTLAYGADYVDAGVTITDNKDTGLKAKVTYSKDGKVVDKIDTEVAGTYTIHYNVSDAAGNRAKEVTRTVVVDAVDSIRVSTLDELNAALADETKATIILSANIETEKKITVTRKVSINGGNHSIAFKGDTDGWQGNYVLHVYNASGVTISDLNLTSGDAGLLVNGSDVTLEGDVNVGGNEFGGIEVSKGAAPGLNNSLLNVAGTLTNETESYGKPTIWVIDGQGEVDNAPATSTTTIEPGQTQYYLEAIHGSPVITSTIKDAAYTDVEQDVEVSTVANGKAGSNVKVVITLDDSTQAENLDLQYYEVADQNYHPLNFNSGVAVFGPSSGFQLKDAKSKFKVTYKQVGTYGYKLELIEVATEKVLASTHHKVIVTKAPKPENFVVAQDFGYWADYQAYNVGFQLQLNNISYDDIDKIEVALEDEEGKPLATRTATGAQIEKLASDDMENGDLDGQLSVAFTDREKAGSNEWWDSTPYDITQKPSKAKITITLKNGESYSVYNMILSGEYVPETPEEPLVTGEQQVPEEPQQPQDTQPTGEQQGPQDTQEMGTNN
uniref:S-layer homology domain-containing protein n=1 Tax=Paenibacillus terrae TaxID=159743 RepID=UPI0011A1597D|nr:S-layer homology domain-containing protein [Paenibacillus terrae]